MSPQQRLELDGELESEYRGFGTGREGADQGEQCTIYLKKSLPVSQSGTFWLSPTPSLPSRGWDAQFPRVCTYAVVGNWLICNLHLDHLGHQSQLEGLRQIRRFTRDFPNCSVVVLGDLNVAPDSPTLLEMRDYSDIYAQLHPTMARSTTYHGFGQEPTYPRIDYVFTSPDVRGLRSEVLFEPGPSYSSDHFPLTATLERRR